MTYTVLIIGFIFLIKGADLLVDGASSVARKFNISNLVIGLTIVAFGTSAPELFVNIYASIQGTTDIAIGNIIGSNIVNMLFILGVAAVIYPLTVTKGTVWKEIPLSLLAALLVFLMANDILFDGMNANILTRIDGLVLIAFFIIFLYYTFGIAKTQGNTAPSEEIVMHSAWKSSGMILLGLVGLVLGGHWIVGSATTIAVSLGLSQALIGLTIVAIGTSLPELATSAVAAYKKNSDIAVGNVVGSNIFNIFWILGLSATINPLPFSSILNFDVLVAIGAALILFAIMFIWKRHTIGRREGIMLIVLYIIYTVIIVMRG